MQGDGLGLATNRLSTLRIVPNGPGALDLRFVWEDGTFLELQGGDRFRRRSFRLDGRGYEIRRAWRGGDWLLEEDRLVHARARRRWSGSRVMDVSVAGRPYRLQPRSAMRRELLLFHGPALVGRIRPVRPVGREGVARLPDQMPEPYRIFVASVAATTWWRPYSLAWLLFLSG